MFPSDQVQYLTTRTTPAIPEPQPQGVISIQSQELWKTSKSFAFATVFICLNLSPSFLLPPPLPSELCVYCVINLDGFVLAQNFLFVLPFRSSPSLLYLEFKFRTSMVDSWPSPRLNVQSKRKKNYLLKFHFFFKLMQ